MELPTCLKCNKGVMIPFSDYGQGAAVHYKAWCCHNPECLFTIKIKNGDLQIGEQVTVPRR